MSRRTAGYAVKPDHHSLFHEIEEGFFVGLEVVTREIEGDGEPLGRRVREKRGSHSNNPISRHGHLPRYQALAADLLRP